MHKLVIEALAELPPASVVNRLSDFAFHCSRDGSQLIDINPSATDFFGFSQAEFRCFHPWWKQLFRDEAQARFQTLIQMLDQPDADMAPLDFECLNSGGANICFVIHTAFTTPTSVLLLGQGSAIADAEETLRQAQARFRSIVDSLSINLVLKDKHGRRVYANRSYLELRGLQMADILGKTDRDLFPPDIADRFSSDDEHVLRTGEVIRKSEENVTNDGRRIWTEIHKGPLHDADNQITGIQILFWDATQRKTTEQALEREHYLLHALLDNIPDSIYFKDRESRFMRISRGMAQKFNLASPEVAIGKTDADIFTTEHARQAREDELRIMETLEPIVAVVERETWPDRPDSWCSSTKLPLLDSDGKVVGTFGISRDVSELMLVDQQLREARDQADQANQAKSEFLANMSHEIRTPMNGIIGMAELLSHTQLDERQKTSLAMIEQSAQSLLRIINDILDFSKIEAGKFQIDTAPLELRKCVSQAMDVLVIRAGNKQLELITAIEDDVPDRLMGDADRLRQVLINLVGNSIKFTDKGSIKVRVDVVTGPPSEADYTLHFSVTDTGIGIPLRKQKAIFDAFSQADESTTRQYGGTGLGLSISSQLIEMMGGKIWLESTPGSGSTFHFTCCMPLADDSHFDDGVRQGTSLAANDQDVAPEHHTVPLQLLVAEDGEVNRMVLVGLLQQAGHQVVTAVDGRETLKIWQSFAFDAIFMDVQMPVMDGLEATQHIRAAETNLGDVPRLPIIAVTAAAQASDYAICLEAGMDDYLSKPIDFPRLDQILARLQAHKMRPDRSQPFEPTATPESQPHRSTAPPARLLNFDAPVKKLFPSASQHTQLVRTLEKEIQQRLQELRTSIANQDTKLLIRASHSLTSAAALFESHKIAEIAATIERAARTGDLHTAAANLARLEEHANPALMEVQAWLASRGP